MAQAATFSANDMTSAARVTSASLRAELENARAQSSHLSKQVRALEARLSHKLGEPQVIETAIGVGTGPGLMHRRIVSLVADRSKRPEWRQVALER